jgi:hypothetical protein
MGRLGWLICFLFFALQGVWSQQAFVDEQFGAFGSGTSGMSVSGNTSGEFASGSLKSGFVSIAQFINHQARLSNINISPRITGSLCQVSSGSIELSGIVLDSGFNYRWEGPNGFTASDGQIDGLEPGVYRLTIAYFEAKKTLVFEVPEIPIYQGLEICRVTADQDSGGNRIWFSDQGMYHGAWYEVFREELESGNFVKIAQVASTADNYLDNSVELSSRSFRYRVRFVDKCDSLSEFSPVHQTLFLQSSVGVDENQVNLQWSPYQGRPVSSYVIYRSVNDQAFELLTTLPSSVHAFTDSTAFHKSNTYAYYVEGTMDPCLEDGQIQSIRSNTYKIIAEDQQDNDQDGVVNGVDQCPNSAVGAAVDVFGCPVFSLPRDAFSLKVLSATCPGMANGSLTINASYQNYSYLWSINGGDRAPLTGFSQTIENLSAGSYEVCMYVDGVTSYQQCFSVNIAEPPALGASASVDRSARLVTLNLSGSDKYYITHNGITTTTDKQQVTIALRSGSNTLEVNTDLGCQGTFFEEVFVSEEVILYPNPTQGMIQVYVAGIDQSIKTELRDLSGNIRIQQEVSVPRNRVIELDLTQLPTGVYVLMLSGETVRTTTKIIKE